MHTHHKHSDLLLRYLSLDNGSCLDGAERSDHGHRPDILDGSLLDHQTLNPASCWVGLITCTTY